jgi:UDP-glucose 4-epimerase
MRFGNIVVTGGNGALGQLLVRDLMQDADVTSLDIKPGPRSVRSRYVDILAFEALQEALKGHDAVVHLAALLTLEHSEERIFNVNVQGTWNVLEAAHRLGIRRVVLLSSETTTGIVTVRRVPRARPDYLPIDERHPLASIEAYGLSKQVLECVGQSYARRGMDVIALRPTLILMPWMQDYVRRVRGIEDPDLWSYVEAQDVVQAVRKSLMLDRPGFDAFYLSAVDTFAPEPTLTFLERVYGGLPPIRKPELYRDNPYASMWDLTHARDVLGFEPRSSWRRLLEADASEDVDRARRTTADGPPGE